MKLLTGLLAATFVCSVPGNAWASTPQGFSARDLYDACKHTVEKLEEGPQPVGEPKKVQSCFFYVMGAADMAASMSPSSIYGGQICVPKNYAFQDVARKIIALGVEHPTLFDREAPAGLLAYYAVKETYGSSQACPNTDAKSE